MLAIVASLLSQYPVVTNPLYYNTSVSLSNCTFTNITRLSECSGVIAVEGVPQFEAFNCTFKNIDVEGSQYDYFGIITLMNHTIASFTRCRFTNITNKAYHSSISSIIYAYRHTVVSMVGCFFEKIALKSTHAIRSGVITLKYNSKGSMSNCRFTSCIFKAKVVASSGVIYCDTRTRLHCESIYFRNISTTATLTTAFNMFSLRGLCKASLTRIVCDSRIFNYHYNSPYRYLFATSSCTVELNNCTFYHFRINGTALSSTPSLILLQQDINMTLNHCSFREYHAFANTSGSGRIVHATTRCRICFNNCKARNILMENYGKQGGIFYAYGCCYVSVINSHFTNCLIKGKTCRGAVFGVKGASKVYIGHSSFENCHALCNISQGGVISCQDNTTLYVVDTLFTNCSSSATGGAIDIEDGQLSLESVTFNSTSSSLGSCCYAINSGYTSLVNITILNTDTVGICCTGFRLLAYLLSISASQSSSSLLSLDYETSFISNVNVHNCTSSSFLALRGSTFTIHSTDLCSSTFSIAFDNEFLTTLNVQYLSLHNLTTSSIFQNDRYSLDTCASSDPLPLNCTINSTIYFYSAPLLPVDTPTPSPIPSPSHAPRPLSISHTVVPSLTLTYYQITEVENTVTDTLTVFCNAADTCIPIDAKLIHESITITMVFGYSFIYVPSFLLTPGPLPSSSSPFTIYILVAFPSLLLLIYLFNRYLFSPEDSPAMLDDPEVDLTADTIL